MWKFKLVRFLIEEGLDRLERRKNFNSIIIKIKIF